MIEQEEVFFSEEQSLQLITQMIQKAKNDFVETGISALLWGSIIPFCSLVQFISFYHPFGGAEYVWILTFLAVIPQVIISVKENKNKKFKGYHESAMGGIWIAFAISMFLLSFYFSFLSSQGIDINKLHQDTLYLIIYGIPTFSTGIGRRFKPMIIGGIACWALAIISVFTTYPYNMLLMAAGAILAWFIPGLILQRRYKNAKKEQQHV
ncbi:MAG: hypothetical protein M3R72_11940 [Bacteroidota bacterium]|nr:hypothetical protein [Bacteroidota bacterium]